ncbi:MAG: PhoP regulatory network YrbL family protein [Acetobacter sp.]|nr:PhoP regulatory network YrbL family protein [Acetobacter sp.]
MIGYKAKRPQNWGRFYDYEFYLSVTDFSASAIISFKSMPIQEETIIRLRNVGLFCLFTIRVIAVWLIPVSLDICNLVILRSIRFFQEFQLLFGIFFLHLLYFIGRGAKRICFEHPVYSNKCVKISIHPKDNELLFRELNTYLFVKPILGEHIVVYEERLVETNLGKGLVCELLRDGNGLYSKSLLYYVQTKGVDSEILSQIRYFAGCLV